MNWEDAHARQKAQPDRGLPLIFAFLAVVILMVLERTAADPLWLQIGQAFQAWATRSLLRSVALGPSTASACAESPAGA